MPNSKSASKRLRQSKVSRMRNRATKSSVKTQITKVRKALEAGEIEKAETEYREAAKKLDKASSNRVLHKNTAARRKSRLQNAIKTAKAG